MKLTSAFEARSRVGEPRAVQPPASRRSRRRAVSTLIAAALPALAATTASAAPLDSVHVSWSLGEQSERLTLPAGAIRLRAVSSAGALAASIVPPAHAPRRFIVRFGAPAAAGTPRSRVEVEAARERQRRFAADLAALESAARAELGDRTAEVRVRRRFETAFDGAAILAPAALAERVRGLPYVTGLYSDDSVHAVLDPGIVQIRADSLRDLMGLTGAGIVVSIVDTGMDYGHPALGGCLGPGCRVLAGHDFVNDDPDPMDDHGHGTHVAGIVGASGAGLQGVAPGVRFLAYKVLGAAGGGLESDVIAGIERSLDPDGDPLTDDGADVVNLSLGSAGDADGPLAQAVDQAVAAGVVCVVAAGNSGDYLTIGSPGCARRALTVGAVTAGDGLASFSSRGPSAPDAAIKPDVVAPGVGVVSTWPGGGSQTLSGTSMAAPYVTGVAALLRELRPDAAPERIRAALMNTAVDLGVDPFQQGAGRIDALAAGRAAVSIRPASLSFGLTSPTTPVWTAVETLTVSNDSTSARVVALEARSNLPPGSWLEVSPATVTLGPGETRFVEVRLRLDQAPAVTGPPYAYHGALYASVDGRTLRVPCAVLRTPQLVLRVDDLSLVIVHDRAAFNRSFVMSGPGSRRLFVPPGTYDVMAFLGFEHRIVREGIVVADSHSVDLFRAGAVHAVQRVCVDEGGRTLSLPVGIEVLRHRDSGAGIVSFGGLGPTTRFSTISPAYDWEWHRLSYGQEPVTYDLQGFQRGVSAPAVIRNDPGDLRHLTIAYHPKPGVGQIVPVRWTSNGPRGVAIANGFAVSSITTTAPLPPLEPPFVQQAYFMSTPDPGSYFRSRIVEAHPYPGGPYPSGNPEIASPYLVADPGQPVRGFLHGDGDRPVLTLDRERLELGYGPPCWFGSFANGPDALRLTPRSGKAGWIFLNPEGDWRNHAHLPFVLARAGLPVESGVMTGGLTRALDPGPHALTVTHDRYWIAGEPGRATVTASFNTLAADPDPPALTELSLLVDGVPADRAGPGASSRVRFVVEDAGQLGPVTLAARWTPGAAWAPVPCGRDGEAFVANLPAAPGGLLSLRIEAEDGAGNRLVYAVEPAVRIEGTPDQAPPGVTVISPNGGESWASGSIHDVTWAATDDVAVDSVAIQISTDGGLAYETIASGLAPTGSHAWRVPATVGDRTRLRIVARDPSGNQGADASDADFTITDGLPPTVALRAPVGGESWETGSTRTIAWEAADDVGVAEIDLACSTDGGVTFPHVLATGIAPAGAWTWTVPSLTTAHARIRVVARDAAGNAARDSSAADFAIVAPPDPNLVGNGGFESGLAGWSAYGRASLTQATEGHGGARALQIRATSSSSFGCDDVPDWITTVAAKGAVYRVSAWVKTPAGSRGRVQLRLYEYLGSSQQGSTASSSSVRLSATWTLLSLDYTVRAAGSRLSLRVVDSPAASRETFLVDDVSITLLGVPADRPPVVTAPAAVRGSPGREIRFDVTASDPDGQAIQSLVESGKPEAASFTLAAPGAGTFAWTPGAADVSDQPRLVTFTAANALAGQASTSIAVSDAPPNLCGNGDFEAGTGGWGPYGNAALAVVAGGRTGNALQVTGSSSFGIDDLPDWLPAPLAKGAVYRVSCHVKGVGSSSGNAKIRVYEYLGSSQQGSTAYSQVLPLTSSWQQLSVDYPVRTQGSRLSLRITDAASSGTVRFLIDDVVIEPLGTGALASAADTTGADEGPQSPGAQGAAAVFAASFVPNPARGEGTLTFVTTRAGAARVDLFDVGGRLVRRLLDERRLEAGSHALRVSRAGAGARLAEGLFFYRISAEEGVIGGRLILLQ